MTEKKSALQKFFVSAPGRMGVVGVFLLVFPALFAPFIANGRPLLMISGGEWSLPFIRHFFAPGHTEGDVFVERCFNYLALFVPLAVVVALSVRRRLRLRRWLLAILALLLALPFFLWHDLLPWYSCGSSIQ